VNQGLEHGADQTGDVVAGVGEPHEVRVRFILAVRQDVVDERLDELVDRNRTVVQIVKQLVSEIERGYPPLVYACRRLESQADVECSQQRSRGIVSRESLFAHGWSRSAC
jgi:hypothetical protein